MSLLKTILGTFLNTSTCKSNSSEFTLCLLSKILLFAFNAVCLHRFFVCIDPISYLYWLWSLAAFSATICSSKSIEEASSRCKVCICYNVHWSKICVWLNNDLIWIFMLLYMCVCYKSSASYQMIMSKFFFWVGRRVHKSCDIFVDDSSFLLLK